MKEEINKGVGTGLLDEIVVQIKIFLASKVRLIKASKGELYLGSKEMKRKGRGVYSIQFNFLKFYKEHVH